tara:strand:- start:621 stop:797 length:177 start_codon:yes stop_codon:yes gene_type:complete
MRYETEYDKNGKLIGKIPIPENAKDIKILRADYNQRHANEPGFVPSVEYDKNGNPVVS